MRHEKDVALEPFAEMCHQFVLDLPFDVTGEQHTALTAREPSQRMMHCCVPVDVLFAG